MLHLVGSKKKNLNFAQFCSILLNFCSIWLNRAELGKNEQNCVRVVRLSEATKVAGQKIHIVNVTRWDVSKLVKNLLNESLKRELI